MFWGHAGPLHQTVMTRGSCIAPLAFIALWHVKSAPTPPPPLYKILGIANSSIEAGASGMVEVNYLLPWDSLQVQHCMSRTHDKRSDVTVPPIIISQHWLFLCCLQQRAVEDQNGQGNRVQNVPSTDLQDTVLTIGTGRRDHNWGEPEI